MIKRSRPALCRKKTPHQVFARLATVALSIIIPTAGVALATIAAPASASNSGTLRTSAPFIALAAPTAALEVNEKASIEKQPVYEVIATGMASYYGRELAGNRTASGERFNPSKLTAAHRTLPMGSMVRVKNSLTGQTVIVRVNDRGPFHGNRLIDLSEEAARQIGLRAAGKGKVEIAIEAD